MENFLCCLTFFEWKNTCFLHKDYFNLNEMTESECLSEFSCGKRDILM